MSILQKKSLKIPKFNRLIHQQHLKEALQYLESQHAGFHTARLQYAWPEPEQQVPQQYRDGEFFVVSRIAPPSRLERFDNSFRQCFHQFEALAPASCSPSRSTLQVAMSQQIARGTPRRQSLEQAARSLMPKYDHF